MSFAARLAKRPPLGAVAERPTKSEGLALCFPHLLRVAGKTKGLVDLETAPFVVGGIEALRILDALDELLGTVDEAGLPPELQEAARHVRSHMQSVQAASDLAHAQHEAFHAGEKGGFH